MGRALHLPVVSRSSFLRLSSSSDALLCVGSHGCSGWMRSSLSTSPPQSLCSATTFLAKLLAREFSSAVCAVHRTGSRIPCGSGSQARRMEFQCCTPLPTTRTRASFCMLRHSRLSLSLPVSICRGLRRLLVALNAELQKATAAKGTHALDPYFDLTNITLWPMFKKVRRRCFLRGPLCFLRCLRANASIFLRRRCWMHTWTRSRT